MCGRRGAGRGLQPVRHDAATDGRTRSVGTIRPSYRAALSGPVHAPARDGDCGAELLRLDRCLLRNLPASRLTACPLAGIVVPLAVFALGSILGTILGGQLADRLANRLLTFAGAMFGSALIALPLFGWTAGLPGSVALAFAYVFVNAVGRPSLMASLADVPDEVRGTVLGLNVTSASFGWLGAASLGGWMMVQYGFAGFGPLAACVGLLAAGLALIGRRPRSLTAQDR